MKMTWWLWPIDLDTKLMRKYASAIPHNTDERSYKVMDKKTKTKTTNWGHAGLMYIYIYVYIIYIYI